MIEAEGLTKSYVGVAAVDDLSLRVVTGLLGPNGVGKSTTMRMILGLDPPSAVTSRVNSRAYRNSAHPTMTAKQHLTWLRFADVPSGLLDYQSEDGK